jgi:hypothetical protein
MLHPRKHKMRLRVRRCSKRKMAPTVRANSHTAATTLVDAVAIATPTTTAVDNH